MVLGINRFQYLTTILLGLTARPARHDPADHRGGPRPGARGARGLKDVLADVGDRAAREHGRCHVFDNILAELGLTRPVPRYRHGDRHVHHQRGAHQPGRRGSRARPRLLPGLDPRQRVPVRRDGRRPDRRRNHCARCRRRGRQPRRGPTTPPGGVAAPVPHRPERAEPRCPSGTSSTPLITTSIPGKVRQPGRDGAFVPQRLSGCRTCAAFHLTSDGVN